MNLLNVAISLHKQKKFDKAIEAYEKIIKKDSKNTQALNLYAILLQQNGFLERAIGIISEAIRISPNTIEYINNKAYFLSIAQDYNKALGCYLKILSIEPEHDENLNNIGICLNKLNKNEEAIIYFDKALAINKKKFSYYFNKGNSFLKLRNYEEAIDNYSQSIKLNPDHAKSFHNRAFAYEELLSLDESLEDYKKSIELSPNFWMSYVNKSQIHLIRGDFNIGWKMREYRWKIDNFNQLHKYLDQEKVWTGDQTIKGKKILIPFEQGLGDTIQFCRLAKELKKFNCEIILLVQRPLKELITTLDEDITVTCEDIKNIKYDLFCSMLSLPFALKLSFNNIPNSVPYLKAKKDRIDKWKKLFSKTNKKKIGIAWKGNPKNADDYKRSCSLKDIYDLCDTKYEWICLHHELNDDEEKIIEQSNIKNLTNLQNDFNDVVAICESLDLIITVDTSIAHLAGALGKETFLMLAFNPDFRWLTKIDNSPWYPTIKIFRHNKKSDWRELFKQVVNKI